MHIHFRHTNTPVPPLYSFQQMVSLGCKRPSVCPCTKQPPISQQVDKTSLVENVETNTWTFLLHGNDSKQSISEMYFTPTHTDPWNTAWVSKRRQPNELTRFKSGKKLFLSTLELELYTCNATYYHDYAIHPHSGHFLGFFVNVFDMMIMDLMLGFTIWRYLKISSLNLSKFYWKNKKMADNSMP